MKQYITSGGFNPYILGSCSHLTEKGLDFQTCFPRSDIRFSSMGSVVRGERGEGFPIVAYRLFFLSSHLHILLAPRTDAYSSEEDIRNCVSVVGGTTAELTGCYPITLSNLGQPDVTLERVNSALSTLTDQLLVSIHGLQSIDFSMRPNGVMGFVIIKPPSPCPHFLLISVCLRILNLYSRTSCAA